MASGTVSSDNENDKPVQFNLDYIPKNAIKF